MGEWGQSVPCLGQPLPTLYHISYADSYLRYTVDTLQGKTTYVSFCAVVSVLPCKPHSINPIVGATTNMYFLHMLVVDCTARSMNPCSSNQIIYCTNTTVHIQYTYAYVHIQYTYTYVQGCHKDVVSSLLALPVLCNIQGNTLYYKYIHTVPQYM